MAAEVIDYEAVLADLEAKKAALDSAIAGIRQMLSLGAQSGAGQAGRGADSVSVESDTFFGMSIGDAAKKFLSLSVPFGIGRQWRVNFYLPERNTLHFGLVGGAGLLIGNGILGHQRCQAQSRNRTNEKLCFDFHVGQSNQNVFQPQMERLVISRG